MNILPDVGSKDFHDRTVVPFRGIPGDPSEGIDPAKTYLQPFVSLIASRPELVDGAREAIRDLPLPVDLQGAPGEVEAREEGRATQDLRQAQDKVFTFSRLVRGDVPVQEHQQSDDHNCEERRQPEDSRGPSPENPFGFVGDLPGPRSGSIQGCLDPAR